MIVQISVNYAIKAIISITNTNAWNVILIVSDVLVVILVWKPDLDTMLINNSILFSPCLNRSKLSPIFKNKDSSSRQCAHQAALLAPIYKHVILVLLADTWNKGNVRYVIQDAEHVHKMRIRYVQAAIVDMGLCSTTV